MAKPNILGLTPIFADYHSQTPECLNLGAGNDIIIFMPLCEPKAHARSLSLLSNAGLLDERKDGKLVFYSLSKGLPSSARSIINVLKKN